MSSVGSQSVVKLAEQAVGCRECSLHGICSPAGASTSLMDQLNTIIRKRRPLARGEHLYRTGEPFQSLFCVRSGSVKTYVNAEDGTEQVTGFHLPGEMVGMAGIATQRMPCSAVALETASVCEVPFARFQELCSRTPSMQQEFVQLLSQNILHFQSLMTLMGRKSAEERLAALLFSLSSRFHDRGFSPFEFHLSMSRNDIGNFLGMAVETVSRVFTRFQEEGVLEVQRKHVKLVNLDRIRALAGSVQTELVSRTHH